MPDQQQEWDAAALVVGLIGGRAVQTDRDGAQRRHDFEIRDAGPTIALEVTSTTVKEIRHMWAGIRGEDWLSDILRESWSISIRSAARGEPGPSIKTLRRQIEQHLAVLENEGVQRFGTGGQTALNYAARAAVAALDALGVRGGVVGTRQSGNRQLILVGAVGRGGAPYGDVVNDAVDRAVLAKADKLARSGCEERHLFIWVDWTDHACEAAMSMAPLPDRVPDLPDVVDVVWVALWQPGPTVPTTVLWRVSRDQGWSVPQVRFVDQQLTARTPA